MINVTKTFLPPQQVYGSILSRAWEKGWLTNRGILVRELEDALRDHLNIPNITLTNNGTIPLQIAIKSLGLSGEIITTPFSYVATTSSIVWEGCEPVFVDIEHDHCTIDPVKIEAAITSNTSAILATHVYGNPCDIDAIDAIAEKYNLKVIYDAAHCFDVTYKNESIFNFGDVATCSFHATKLFHTGEGGAMMTKDPELHSKLYEHHNFGHKGQEEFHGLGINAKMSELQAAMGLSVLPYVSEIIESRKKVVEAYDEVISNLNLERLFIRSNCDWNYSYYPVFFRSEDQLLSIKSALESEKIFPRRYFYPSLNTLPYVNRQDCPIAEKKASTVLCLPLYDSLSMNDVERVTKIIMSKI